MNLTQRIELKLQMLQSLIEHELTLRSIPQLTEDLTEVQDLINEIDYAKKDGFEISYVRDGKEYTSYLEN